MEDLGSAGPWDATGNTQWMVVTYYCKFLLHLSEAPGTVTLRVKRKQYRRRGVPKCLVLEDFALV